MKNKREWTYVIPKVTRDYFVHVMITMAEMPPGLYGMDEMRSELHAELSERYDLTQEQTRDVTDHMDKLRKHDGGGSIALHEALQDLWDKYPAEERRK